MTHPTLELQRARAAEAIARRDLGELRRLLEDGATFASFSIRNPTERAESEFGRWIAAGRPDSLRRIKTHLRTAAERRLAAVRELSDSEVWALATLGSPAAEIKFAELVWGYGPAKASFALACAGFGRLACIDSRMLAKHAAELATFAAELGAGSFLAAVRRVNGWQAYLGACELLWGSADDYASGQWIEWLDDLARERYRTSHGFLATGTAATPAAAVRG